MSKNKLKQKEEAEEPKVSKSKKQDMAGARRLVRFINIFGVFNRNQIVHAMPFILFITVMIIGYIANSYYAERIVRDINKTKRELKEKKAEHISVQSALIYDSRQSTVAKSVENMEIKESTEPPHLIRAQDQNKKDKK
ncbi:MAG TPA: FtsL-like putative cell division protein [Bacteroidia bacterium]|nr:FtsL-like putative cell division protein [Bacteroidia bacterium]HNS12279.1 FtsL-like putative cell division protein [Bacteroidia bacterium]